MKYMTDYPLSGSLICNGSLAYTNTIQSFTPRLTFNIPGGPLITFKPDGMIELGKEYRENPDEAVRLFLELLQEQFKAMIDSAYNRGYKDGNDQALDDY